MAKGSERFQTEGVNKYLAMDRGQIFYINNVEANDGGTYTCIVHVGHLTVGLSSAKLVVIVPPDPPKDVSIISCGNMAELQWTPGRDGGANITGYLVQFNTSDNPSEWINYHDEIPGKVQTTYVNLPPWGMYNFRVLARNKVDYSKPSNPTRQPCTTPPERPSTNPKDVRTQTHKKGKLIVSWTPMPRLLYNGPGFQYVIYWRRKGSTYWNENIEQHPKASMWEVSVNETYALYEIKVKAMNQIGESRQPAFIYLGYSGEGEPTVVPKDFRLDPTKPIGAHRAHFIWEAVDTSEEKIKGEFKGYKLRYWKSSEGRHKWKEVDIVITREDHDRPDVRAAIDGLPANTALRAQVSVMNTHYTGPSSQIIDFLTPEGVPSPVRELRIDQHGTTFALLKWLPPEEPNGLLLGYDIGYQQITGESPGRIKPLRPQINNPDSLGARITGLEPNHDYRFYVWARTNTGRGEGAHTDVTTKDGDPPDPPKPKFTSVYQTSVNITWSPYRLVDVTYETEYRPAGEAEWKVANSEWGRNWMVINDLSPNMEYEVRLVAKNKHGDMASSTLYRVKTQPRQGGDAHLYQQDEAYSTPTSGASDINHTAGFTILCAIFCSVGLQTLASLVSVTVFFH
ncbi:neuroglian-like isoform X2 [Dreissena polymorpha]|uniref:neuroglian-like isoform X2 n=1 Tax=Dreissena polymorpha TaxID=45954 RepID=UPI00226427DC|nr:neuroglian-like isoform X2 [Dreissena polymorpha]